MKKMVLLLLLAGNAQAVSLTKFWVSGGKYKVPMDDLPPSTTNYNWNGDRGYFFGMKNEYVSVALVIGNDTASNVSEVTASLSSLVGPSTISSVVVSSMNVWDMTNRPIQGWITRYKPILGNAQLAWEDYFDMYHNPTRFRTACTIENGTYDQRCFPNVGQVWADRPDHDKYYPIILEPLENVAVSSFTVYASSSQMIWWDVYLDKSLAAGTYTGTITVKEGVTTSTSIPVSLKVYNNTLPDTPTLPAMVYVENGDVQTRLRGSNCASPETEPCRENLKRFYQMLHAHGVSPIGNDRTTSDSPWEIDVTRLSGTLYSSTTGYYGRGQDTGDPIYSIGTYAGWQANWGTTNATTICSHLSAWATWFKNNYPSVKSLWYISDEGADTNANDEKWAQWNSTVTTCQVAGYAINNFLTHSFDDAKNNVPHVNMPCQSSMIGVASTTIQTDAEYYSQGLTPGTTTSCVYNGSRPSWGTITEDMDDGTSPLALFTSLHKKNLGVYFYWNATYYNDYQSGRGQNDLWNVAQTFGATPSSDALDGLKSNNYSNGDGVLMYPGTDTLFPSDSRGVNAPYPGVRLKLMRDGIQYFDYIAMAKAINATTTNSIEATLLPSPIMWELQCHNLGDCTYVWGKPTWSDDPDIWESNRETLAQIIDSGISKSKLKGGVKLKGGIKL